MSRAMKIARIEAGLTQQELARRAKVSESTITRIETGRSANREVCDRLARILGHDINEPKTLALVPPSVEPELWDPLKAFSISSTHSTQGAIASAV